MHGMSYFFCTSMVMLVPPYEWRWQRTTRSSKFSPSTRWVPGMENKPLSLVIFI